MAASAVGERQIFPKQTKQTRIIESIVTEDATSYSPKPGLGLLAALPAFTLSAMDSKLGPVAALVLRGEDVEAWHSASVAVVDADQRLIASFGEPELVLFARSSIKPLQALALVESGALDAFGISSEELAIACASHSGTDEHVRIVQRLLRSCGADVSHLACGAHLPIAYRIAGRMPMQGEDTDPLRHNCSGKHAGFLAVSARLGEPLLDYLQEGSRTQSLVRRLVAETCGATVAEMRSGIDGCSAPNYALSLVSLARAFSKLALATRGTALSRVRQAMLDHPRLVSGEARLDYDLMRSFPGNIVCKGGAEAVELMAFQNPPLAMAIKVHDGASRALAPICVAVIEQLGILGGELPEPLVRHRSPLLKNYRRLTTGRIRATLKLRGLNEDSPNWKNWLQSLARDKPPS